MKTGRVRSIVAKKMFGFISSGSKNDYFFHREDFQGHWDDLVNDFESNYEINVQFEEVKSPKGPRAQNVTRIDAGIGRM